MPDVQQVVTTTLSVSSQEPKESPRLAPEHATGDFLFPAADGTPEGESYQQFLDSMAQYCRCRDSERPCDGVLAGGMCDGLMDEDEYGDEPDPEEDDGYPFDLTP